jgi:hypothetical protein
MLFAGKLILSNTNGNRLRFWPDSTPTTALSWTSASCQASIVQRDSTFVRRTLGCFEGHISMDWQDYLLVSRHSAQLGNSDFRAALGR